MKVYELLNRVCERHPKARPDGLDYNEACKWWTLEAVVIHSDLAHCLIEAYVWRQLPGYSFEFVSEGPNPFYRVYSGGPGIYRAPKLVQALLWALDHKNPT